MTPDRHAEPDRSGSAERRAARRLQRWVKAAVALNLLVIGVVLLPAAMVVASGRRDGWDGLVIVVSVMFAVGIAAVDGLAIALSWFVTRRRVVDGTASLSIPAMTGLNVIALAAPVGIAVLSMTKADGSGARTAGALAFLGGIVAVAVVAALLVSRKSS